MTLTGGAPRFRNRRRLSFLPCLENLADVPPTPLRPDAGLQAHLAGGVEVDAHLLARLDGAAAQQRDLDLGRDRGAAATAAAAAATAATAAAAATAGVAVAVAVGVALPPGVAVGDGVGVGVPYPT